MGGTGGKLGECEVLKPSLAVIFGKEKVVCSSRVFEESLIKGTFYNGVIRVWKKPKEIIQLPKG